MQDFPRDFFTAPASKSLPRSLYAVVARRPAMADPYTLATSFFCSGKENCKWTMSYFDVMNIKIATNPKETEDRRKTSRHFIKQNAFSVESNPNGPWIFMPDGVFMNVIHFPVDRARHGLRLGEEQSSGGADMEHALVIGPCSKEDYNVALRALGSIGIHESHVNMHVQVTDGELYDADTADDHGGD